MTEVEGRAAVTSGVPTQEDRPAAAGSLPDFMSRLRAKNPAEPEFHQAVQEVVESLEVVLERHPEYQAAKILERLVEPERVDHVPRALGRTTRARCRSTAATASR